MQKCRNECVAHDHEYLMRKIHHVHGLRTTEQETQISDRLAARNAHIGLRELGNIIFDGKIMSGGGQQQQERPVQYVNEERNWFSS